MSILKAVLVVMDCQKCKTEQDEFQLFVMEDGVIILATTCTNCGAEVVRQTSMEELMGDFPKGGS